MFVKKKRNWLKRADFSLQTDIGPISHWVKEKLIFLGIDQKTLNDVREASAYIKPHRDEIVDVFYTHLIRFQHLNQFINKHSTIERLKKTMRQYLDDFLRADIDDQYVKRRIEIGRAHSGIGLTADHFISSHHLILQMMSSILIANKRSEYLLSLQKIGAFDQQLITEVYMEHTFKQFLFGISDLINHTTELDTTRSLMMQMERQKEETHNVTVATEEMIASLQEVTNHAIKVSEGMDEAVSSILQSKQVIDEALDNIREIRSVYKTVLEKVKHLEDEIEQVQKVVQIITGIAEQTNLLALNASIEAARAGEQGKGFAVVASEVRKLSEHTKEQISQISQNMNALRSVSEQVVTEIIETSKFIDKSVDDAQFAGNALANIVTTMRAMNDGTSQIAAMNEEQSAAVLEIAKRNNAIDQLSNETQMIAKKTAESVLGLSKKMEEYRHLFFTINIPFQAQDMIRMAITDHLLWKWKVYNMILGLEHIEEVTSYKQCRLGTWYYGDVPEHIRSLDVFKRIEKPHKEVHECAGRAVEYYKAGDFERAQEEFERLENVSEQVVSLLKQLEASL